MANDLDEQCLQKQELIDQAQRILSRLAELAHAQQDAITSDDAQRIQRIDSEIEHLLGEKERAIGALRQHREEHGC